jgi:hypothetical protein
MDRITDVLRSRTVIAVIVIVLVSFMPELKDTLMSVFPEGFENQETLTVVLGALAVYFRANPRAKL